MRYGYFDIDERAWRYIEPLLPDQSAKPQGGRPPLTNYQVLNGILFRLHTGCHWKALPRRFGCGSSVHKHFQRWVRAGIFDKIFDVLVHFYDGLRGIDRKWASLDGSIVKAPRGGEKTGRNPTDRGKSGAKRHVLADGRGVPIGIATSAANVNDCKRVEETLDAVKKSRRPENICMDKGYDAKAVDAAVKERGVTPHTRRRGEPPLLGPYRGRARRWVVERTHSWHNRFRGIFTRWEKKAANYHGLVMLASGLIAFQQAMKGLC
jgi:putative transposase